jgi:hypothetical protein
VGDVLIGPYKRYARLGLDLDSVTARWVITWTVQRTSQNRFFASGLTEAKVYAERRLGVTNGWVSDGDGGYRPR